MTPAKLIIYSLIAVAILYLVKQEEPEEEYLGDNTLLRKP